jgi:hypothetical protein
MGVGWMPRGRSWVRSGFMGGERRSSPQRTQRMRRGIPRFARDGNGKNEQPGTPTEVCATKKKRARG